MWILFDHIGADHVIDYTKEDFTKGDQRYDMIFDNVQNHTFSERRRVLTPNGIWFWPASAAQAGTRIPGRIWFGRLQRR